MLKSVDVKKTPVLQHGGDDEICTCSVVAYLTFRLGDVHNAVQKNLCDVATATQNVGESMATQHELDGILSRIKQLSLKEQLTLVVRVLEDVQAKITRETRPARRAARKVVA